MKLNGYSLEFVNKKITSAGGRILCYHQNIKYLIFYATRIVQMPLTRILMNPSSICNPISIIFLIFGFATNSYHQPIFVRQLFGDKCCLVFALFYFLTNQRMLCFFLKKEKDFLLEQVWKFNLIIIRDNLPTYQYEERFIGE
jgi:hypothetical protein